MAAASTASQTKASEPTPTDGVDVMRESVIDQYNSSWKIVFASEYAAKFLESWKEMVKTAEGAASYAKQSCTDGLVPEQFLVVFDEIASPQWNGGNVPEAHRIGVIFRTELALKSAVQEARAAMIQQKINRALEAAHAAGSKAVRICMKVDCDDPSCPNKQENPTPGVHLIDKCDKKNCQQCLGLK